MLSAPRWTPSRRRNCCRRAFPFRAGAGNPRAARDSLTRRLPRCRCLGRCSIYDYCSSVLDALAGQVPGVPDLVGSQYSTVSQHRLSWFVGLGCWDARSPGREHTLTYGRRRMAFLLGLSSCNSNPPLHARRLVSNLIGEWNKDGERASEGGRPRQSDGQWNHFINSPPK